MGNISGYNRANKSYSSVVGGQFNRIVAGDQSVILGGSTNLINSPCSAILGGKNNTIGAGYPYSAVFGNGVSAVAANTFHVQCLNAINTPNVATGPFPSGSIYWKSGTALLASDRVLVVAP